MTKLPSTNVRKVFHIQSGTIDLKGVRKYKYGEDTRCRLSDSDVESILHVVNDCPSVSRKKVEDTFSNDCDELLEVSERCLEFDTKVEELEKCVYG